MVLLEETTYEALLKNRKAQADEITLLKAEVEWYKQQFGLAQRRLYGPSSEKSPVGLFPLHPCCAAARQRTRKRCFSTRRKPAHLRPFPTPQLKRSPTRATRRQRGRNPPATLPVVACLASPFPFFRRLGPAAIFSGRWAAEASQIWADFGVGPRLSDAKLR